MTDEKQETCEERIDEEMSTTMITLRTLWEDYRDGGEGVEDVGYWPDYGLCFDYVEPGTFGEEQTVGYHRYQICWGGPSEEFRFFHNSDGDCRGVEYWFMDWFDGATRTLTGEDLAMLREIYDHFGECGMLTDTSEEYG